MQPYSYRQRGHQRSNGRWEGRYRPQSIIPLIEDSVICQAYKGKIQGIHKYEFLRYFDSCEEKDEWIRVKKEDFRRRKLEAQSAFLSKKQHMKKKQRVEPLRDSKKNKNSNNENHNFVIPKTDLDSLVLSSSSSSFRSSSSSLRTKNNITPRRCKNKVKNKQQQNPVRFSQRVLKRKIATENFLEATTISHQDDDGGTISEASTQRTTSKLSTATIMIKLSSVPTRQKTCRFPVSSSYDNNVTMRNFCSTTTCCGTRMQLPCDFCSSNIEKLINVVDDNDDDEIGNALLDGLIDKLASSLPTPSLKSQIDTVDDNSTDNDNDDEEVGIALIDGLIDKLASLSTPLLNTPPTEVSYESCYMNEEDNIAKENVLSSTTDLNFQKSGIETLVSTVLDSPGGTTFFC